MSGLVTGSIYALMMVGMTLIYGTLCTLEHGAGAMGASVAGTSRGCCPAALGPARPASSAPRRRVPLRRVDRAGRRATADREGRPRFEMTAFISTFAGGDRARERRAGDLRRAKKAARPVIARALRLIEG